MKKFFILLNNYLSNFWFALLLLTIGGFLVIFFDPIKAVVFSFGKNGEFASISIILWRFWVLFLLPLAGISAILVTIIWLKDKTGNSYRGFIALMTTLLTLGLLFLFIPKLSILDQDIKSNTGIFKMPVIEPEPASVFSPNLEELDAIGQTSIDKSDWQTYKNDHYGFEIKGPKSWNIKLNNNVGLLESTDPNNHTGNYLFFQPSLNDYKLNGYVPFELGAQDNPENLSITDWMLKKDPINNSHWQEGFVKLGIPTTEEAVAFYMNNPYGEGTYTYYIKKNKKMFSFHWMDINPDGMKNSSAMMNAIVKTLIFK